MIRFRNFFKEEKEVHHDMTWMRGNPLHRGHETVVGQTVKSAAAHKGGHSVVLTHSQDSEKNPLSPEQKLKHARRAFPGVNVETSSKQAPTILHHASKLHKQGVTHLTVHVGSDRVKEFHDLLHKYNGVEGRHGHYNFKKINVVPVGGERKAEGSGIESYSATKMRKAAAENDRDSFHKMAPSKMSTRHKDEMMKDVRNGMNIKEEITTGSIGGLGYNSGNPAVDKEKLSSYVQTNSLAKDNENGDILNKMIKATFGKNKVGFKQFFANRK